MLKKLKSENAKNNSECLLSFSKTVVFFGLFKNFENKTAIKYLSISFKYESSETLKSNIQKPSKKSEIIF